MSLEKAKATMPLLRTPVQGGGVHIDPGTYKVRCMDVKPDHLDNSQFGTGDVIRFSLETEVLNPADGNPVTLDAMANDRLTPKSKLWGWLTAFGMKLDFSVDCDIEEAVSREAYAVVVDQPGKEGGVFSRVEDIIPLPKSQMPPKSAAKDDGEPDFDAFWKAVRAMGKESKDLIPFLPNKDLTDMPNMSGADLVALLERLKG